MRADAALYDEHYPYADRSQPGMLYYSQALRRLLDKHKAYERWKWREQPPDASWTAFCAKGGPWARWLRARRNRIAARDSRERLHSLIVQHLTEDFSIGDLLDDPVIVDAISQRGARSQRVTDTCAKPAGVKIR